MNDNSGPTEVPKSDSKPELEANPSNCIVRGGDVTFSVKSAYGTKRYQWYKDGKKLDLATKRSWKLTNARSRDAGKYSVEVINEDGKACSDAIVLSVISPSPDVVVPDQVAELMGRLEVLERVEQPLASGLIQNVKEYRDHLTELNDTARRHADAFEEKLTKSVDKAQSLTLLILLGGIAGMIGIFLYMVTSAKDLVADTKNEAEKRIKDLVLQETLSEKALGMVKRDFDTRFKAQISKLAFINVSTQMRSLADDLRVQLKEMQLKNQGETLKSVTRIILLRSTMKALEDAYADGLVQGTIEVDRCMSLLSMLNGMREESEANGNVDEARKWYGQSRSIDPGFIEADCILASSFIAEMNLGSPYHWKPEEKRQKALDILKSLNTRLTSSRKEFQELQKNLSPTQKRMAKELMVHLPVLEITTNMPMEEVKIRLRQSIKQGTDLARQINETSFIHQDPNLSRLYHTIALRYGDLIDNSGNDFGQSDRANAIRNFKASADCYPDHLYAMNNLVWYVIHDGHETSLIQTNREKWVIGENGLRKALVDFRAYSVVTNTSFFLDTVARAHYAMGDYDKALEASDRVVDLAREEAYRDGEIDPSQTDSVKEAEKLRREIQLRILPQMPIDNSP